MAENEYFNDLDGMVFVQPEGPAHEVYPLFCHDVDGLDASFGDVTTRLCRTAQKGWKTAITSQGAPSRATFTIETWLAKTRGWLQKMAGRSNKCPISFYVHWQECAPTDVYLNYITAQALQNGVLTAGNKSNMAMQRGDEGQAATPTGQAFDLSVDPEPPEYWKLVHTRRAIVEDEPLRDIAFCNYEQCEGVCGDLSWTCEDGIIVADADPTAAAADVWFTVDGGVTWAAQVGPFITAEDIPSAVCFHTAPDNVRHVVACGTTKVAPSEIAYTDNAGAAWTNVNVGVDNEYFLHSGSLFALNHYNMWAVTDLGNCYFSGDAGATWTDQAAPDPAAGVEEMFYVHFIDSKVGWIVGDANQCWYTTDGGDHWALVTGPLALSDLTCVATLTSERAFVGGALAGAGGLWLTEDAGTTWTAYVGRLAVAENFPGAAADIVAIGDVMFIDEFCGSVTGAYYDGAENYKGTWVTRNGGWDWEFYWDEVDLLDSKEYYAGQATWVCDYNHFFSVGELSNATGLIEELSAKGSV